MTRILMAVLVACLLANDAVAEVERIEVVRRESFAGGRGFGAVGPYEKIVGRLHYRVDPRNPANARVVDLRLAPVWTDGQVHFTGDFVLLKPVDLARGNHRLLYEVNNRGGLAMLARFNLAAGSNDPSTPEHAGNGFLFEQGYTLLWSAWNWDVLPGDGRLQIDLPVATNGGAPITGRVVSEIVVDKPSASEPLAWGNSRCYPVMDPASPDAVLTVRDEQRDTRVPIPRDEWAFARDDRGTRIPDPASLWVRGGFVPGRIYELVYTARDPRVVGLGLAAIRDTLAFFRFASADRAGVSNPLATSRASGTAPDPEHAYIFGISQSGRVIQHMLWQGFHVDEAGRMVFDGAMPHVPGGGKGAFNHRFAQTTRHPSEHEDHQAFADVFPFVPGVEQDPVTGERGDVLAVAITLGKIPLVMYTGTSTEYWARSASLVHTDVTGTRDARLDSHVRLYFIAGGQHQNSRTSARTAYAHPGNPLDHSAPLRALLVALDAWVGRGTPPPDSVYPRIDRGELVAADRHRAAFPAIPGARHPGTLLRPPRLDFGPRFRSDGIAELQPPVFGQPYVTLVPAADADGNDLGGVRTPDVAVPLGTYLGWNPRGETMGATSHLARWSGSFFPFAATEDERLASGDPRPSVTARYPTREMYVAKVRDVAQALVAKRLLLPADADAYVTRAMTTAWPPVAPGVAVTSRPRVPVATLRAIATLQADTFGAGPPAGRFRNNGLRGDTFPAQPVQGVSAIVPAPEGQQWWLALSDNGFGVRWNSPDYLLCLYRLRLHWKTAAGGSGRVEVGETIRLSDPDGRLPFAIGREDTPERWLTGADLDPESFVKRPDGSFWIGDEFGPYLVHVDASGRVLTPPVAPEGLASPDRPGLPPPDAGAPGVARVKRSRGFEALADTGDGRTLLAMLEGPTFDDDPGVARVFAFDAEAGRFTGRTWRYRLERPEHSVTELVRYAPGRYLAVERDGGHGPLAKFKRVFAVRIDERSGEAEKTPVLDLLAIADPDHLGGASDVFTFPFVTTEAVWVQDERTLVLANDNNYPAAGGRADGVRDRTEFIRVELGSPLPK